MTKEDFKKIGYDRYKILFNSCKAMWTSNELTQKCIDSWVAGATSDEVNEHYSQLAKQDSIKYLSWYIQSGYESENIEGTVFTPGDDPEKKISADELHNIFEQNKEL